MKPSRIHLEEYKTQMSKISLHGIIILYTFSNRWKILSGLSWAMQREETTISCPMSYIRDYSWLFVGLDIPLFSLFLVESKPIGLPGNIREQCTSSYTYESKIVYNKKSKNFNLNSFKRTRLISTHVSVSLSADEVIDSAIGTTVSVSLIARFIKLL